MLGTHPNIILLPDLATIQREPEQEEQRGREGPFTGQREKLDKRDIRDDGPTDKHPPPTTREEMRKKTAEEKSAWEERTERKKIVSLTFLYFYF